jgi:hypothetical protein
LKRAVFREDFRLRRGRGYGRRFDDQAEFGQHVVRQFTAEKEREKCAEGQYNSIQSENDSDSEDIRGGEQDTRQTAPHSLPANASAALRAKAGVPRRRAERQGTLGRYRPCERRSRWPSLQKAIVRLLSVVAEVEAEVEAEYAEAVLALAWEASFFAVDQD